jgi:hypothetical protein
MGHIQLRRYTIEPGRFDDFLEFWRGLLPIREQYGYRVLFAFVDREHNQFVWAVEHPDPLEVAESVYNTSPERLEHVTTKNPRVVTNLVVSEVEPEVSWRSSAA